MPHSDCSLCDIGYEKDQKRRGRFMIILVLIKLILVFNSTVASSRQAISLLILEFQFFESSLQLWLMWLHALNQLSKLFCVTFENVFWSEIWLDQILLCTKVGCVFPIVVSSEFRTRQYRYVDHREDSPHFTTRNWH